MELRIPGERFQNALWFCVDNGLDVKEVFTFVVGVKEYAIPKAFAVLGSETVLDEYKKNKDVSQCAVDVDDPNDLFGNVISLFQGNTIVVNQSEYDFYFNVISFLKIESVYQQLQNKFEEELELNNCIDYLKYKDILNFSTENEIDFIIKHFSELNSKDILNINKDKLIEILNKESLIIQNDDDFFQMIEGIVQNNKDYKFLFDYVHYENLTKETLDKSTFQNMNFSSNIVKKLILKNQELKKKNIFNHESKTKNDIINELIQYFGNYLVNNQFTKEFLEKLIEYCLIDNNINLMNIILNLNNSDINQEYIIYFYLILFN